MAKPSSSWTDLESGTPSGVVVEAGAAGVVRVRLDPLREAGVPGIDYVDQPTFLILPDVIDEGTISVDIRSTIRPGVSEMSRGFAGIAFHIAEDHSRFECVYLRPSNGAREEPPAPRDQRAVQYFSYPHWPFDRLREERGGEFEAGADIGIDQWVRLRVDVAAQTVEVLVDDVEVLSVPRLDAAPAGRVGLFVDIGTEALFRSLEITPRKPRQ